MKSEIIGAKTAQQDITPHKEQPPKKKNSVKKPFAKTGGLSPAEIRKIAANYKRIGTNYYLYTTVLTAKKEPVKILKKWAKSTIKEDYGTKVFDEIDKFFDFTLVPDNTDGYMRNIGGCFNMYEPIKHVPQKGEFPKTQEFLEHIFGNYINVGLDYLTLLYLKPTETLPALCLVSKEQKTGKTTFLNWLLQIYGDNGVILGNEDFSSNFNSSWASKLIIGIDESFIEKRIIKEKIKRLVTADTILAESKGIDKVRRDFIGKFFMLSNNEDNFINLEDEDNRFFVLKIPSVINENPDLLEELTKEIPAFLYFLKERELYHPKKKSRLWFQPEVYATDALRRVVKSSKTILEKTMIDYLAELIDTITVIGENNEEEIKITPMRMADILKEKIRYSSGLHIKIKEIFRSWGLQPANKPSRYRYPVFEYNNYGGQIERTVTFKREVGRFFTIPFKKIQEMNEE
jgi:hypothetical protein